LNDLKILSKMLAAIKGAQDISFDTILNNLENFIGKVSSENINVSKLASVIAEMGESTSKCDGANWIIKYLGDNAKDFSGKTLVFEYYQSSTLGGRYIDVLDNSISSRKVYYEFKSVSVVPPSEFVEQFMKDLGNATSLDQIKWVFNNAKNPLGSSGKTFKEAMQTAIDNLPLTDDLAKKILNNNKAKAYDLHDLIESKFNDIFKLQ